MREPYARHPQSMNARNNTDQTSRFRSIALTGSGPLYKLPGKENFACSLVAEDGQRWVTVFRRV